MRARARRSPQTDLAILNWRRERSVFLGTNQPQEDASWIFQLRMAELERAKSGRTSEPRPWHRLAARLFDYAIWGLVLALLLSQLRALGVVPDGVACWLTHPLLAPMLITRVVDAHRGAADHVGRHDAGEVALRHLPAVLDLRRLRAARHAHATDARVHARRARLGRRRRLRVSAARPDSRRGRVRKLAADQETDWDFARDCLVTHGAAGVVNTVTGVCGLASMVWLYGVAWQQPMADTLGWRDASVADALPSPDWLKHRFSDAGGEFERLLPALSLPSAPQWRRAPGAPTPAPRASGLKDTRADEGPTDAQFAAMMAARRARIDLLKVEGPRMLRAGNARRAMELCRAWVDLDLANAEAWRCLGEAQQAAGEHQDALNSFRKARQHDPSDRSLDAAIDRAQRGIVNDFLNRYRR